MLLLNVIFSSLESTHIHKLTLGIIWQICGVACIVLKLIYNTNNNKLTILPSVYIWFIAKINVCFYYFYYTGFAGELCNFEYNECESNPCLNGGQCSDHIGGFSCKCTRGYTGKRCHIKVS